MDIDSAYARFMQVKEEFEQNIEGVKSEQDVRFQVINRILTEVLGWHFREVRTEVKNEGGFSDYLIEASGRTRAIVEAKRVAEKLSDSRSQNVTYLNVGGPGLKAAQDGIDQATRYCTEEGVDFAILTNGTTWIAFRATRTDGVRPSEGKAIVFNTLDIVQENFAEFFHLLCREAVISKDYRALISEAEGFKLSPQENLHFAFEETSIRAQIPTEHSRDLEEVFDTFFSTISGEEDEDLLIKCFVESKESVHAEKVLARITSEILDQIQPMESSAGTQLASEIERAAAARRGEKVLLIGNKGSGKSTFVDRFFKVSLTPEMRSRCLFLKLDLQLFSGNESSLSEWLDRTLQEQIDHELYQGEPPSFDELQGIFHSTYQQWSQGPHKHLHETDSKAFKIKFGDFLQEKIDHDKHDYCLAQLKNIVRSRKLLPCIVFDNADQFPLSVQQAVFQYANALFQQARICFLIVPITDHTVWQLAKTGPLQSYQAKSFFLPVPSTKKILEKRIEYIGQEIADSDPVGGRYALPNGFQVRLQDLRAFVSCLEEVFITNDFIARRIGYLANFDIRRSLELSKRLMTSHFIGIDRLIQTFITKNDINISRVSITQALVNGKYEKFRQDHSDFIVNIFEVDPNKIGSPLLKLRILSLMLDRHRSEHDPLESYLTCNEIEDYFDAMGVPANLTRSNVQGLIDSRLLEPYDPTDAEITPGQKVSITTSGEMHIEMAMHDPVYFSQMALVTGVRKPDLASDVRNFFNEKSFSSNKMKKIKDIFLEYCIEQDAVFIGVPKITLNYNTQRALVDELQASRKERNVEGRVRWFNAKQGYGFIDLQNREGEAYLSLTVLEECGMRSLSSDEEVICDIAQSVRGYHVTKIEKGANSDGESAGADSKDYPKIQMATVIFYNPDKGFGFLKSEEGGRDILLPRRILNSVGLNEIHEGADVLVEVEMDMKGPVATGIQIE